jgi:broad specificity phosphatase PhoE
VTRVFLVRHAWPERNPRTPPESWPLSAEGRAQAKGIAVPWREVERVVSSPEPKAVETARIASGRDPVVERDFREVERPWTPGYADALRKYLSGEAVDGWETVEAATKRAVAALQRHASGGTAAVVSHATLLTLLLAHLEGRAATYDDWMGIGHGWWRDVEMFRR